MNTSKELPAKLDKDKYYVVILKNSTIEIILKYDKSRQKWCSKNGSQFYAINISYAIESIYYYIRFKGAEVTTLDSEDELNRFLMALELVK